MIKLDCTWCFLNFGICWNLRSHAKIQYIFLLLFLFKKSHLRTFFHWFYREEGTEERRETPTASCLCLDQGSHAQTKYVPWLGIEPAVLWLWNDTPTKPHGTGLPSFPFLGSIVEHWWTLTFEGPQHWSSPHSPTVRMIWGMYYVWRHVYKCVILNKSMIGSSAGRDELWLKAP